jgi:hypothetical protein
MPPSGDLVRYLYVVEVEDADLNLCTLKSITSCDHQSTSHGETYTTIIAVSNHMWSPTRAMSKAEVMRRLVPTVVGGATFTGPRPALAQDYAIIALSSSCISVRLKYRNLPATVMALLMATFRHFTNYAKQNLNIGGSPSTMYSIAAFSHVMQRGSFNEVEDLCRSIECVSPDLLARLAAI